MRRASIFAFAAILIAGCNLRSSQETPQPTMPLVITATPLPKPTVAPPPSLVPATVAPVAIAPPSDTPVPPTAAATATPSPAWYEYEVQPDDTIMGIIRVFGYSYQVEVAQEVVRINDNVFDRNILPEGEIIRIPRQTPTPPPDGAQATVELLATLGIDSDTGLRMNSAVGCHTVVTNDTMVSIAERYNTTLEILSDLNSDLDWSGCNFTLPAGGDDCTPLLTLDSCISVPQPTRMPTRFPTPTGSETPTATPTKLAPRLLYPLDSVIITAPSLVLQWVGIAGLAEDELYLVELADQTALREHRQATSANMYRLPAQLAPSPGSAVLMLWRVSVVMRNEAGAHIYTGEQGSWRRFEWRG